MSEEERLILDTVDQFLERDVQPYVRQLESDDEYPVDIVESMKELGLFGATISTEYGGLGLGASTYSKIVERVSAIWMSVSGIFNSHLIMCAAVERFGNEDMKRYYLPKFASGEMRGAIALTEPDCGTDLQAIRTRAERAGDDYVINGTKIWTTFAHHADRMFCLVRTSTEGKPQEGISFVLLKFDGPGITIKPIISMSGNHEINQVFFDNLRVPQANRVGAENDGWAVAKYLLEFERGGRGWGARLRGNFAILKELSQTRGLDKDAFNHRLARLEMDIQAVEITEQRVIIELQKTGRIGPASSLLKLCAGNALQAITECSLEAIGVYAAPHQLAARDWGSNLEPIGSNDELTVVASYLDQRARSIAGGSNEVQRNIMAKHILGM